MTGDDRLEGRRFRLDVSVRWTASFATLDETGGGSKSCWPCHGEHICEAPRMETDLDTCVVRRRHPRASCSKALGVGTTWQDPRGSEESRGQRARRVFRRSR